ncbi:hypothetical protein JTE90_000432 [Oedothorax gibbosus]|uniref:Uncharacterized protein n=1 Tax=Oedothorax gibbosus TaxID=931172 RepID=A0AAV6UGV2_9ARAC|nr:hypothetical protein JTE90_000432 [Oedothorax gibbosus]
MQISLAADATASLVQNLNAEHVDWVEPFFNVDAALDFCSLLRYFANCLPVLSGAIPSPYLTNSLPVILVPRVVWSNWMLSALPVSV